MTLIAAQETDDEIQILADGLSCDDQLAIIPDYHVAHETVRAWVPGRTTLRKLFPHPSLPLAIAHLGSNQRNGAPIAAVIQDFLQRTASGSCDAAAITERFLAEFNKTGSDETLWLVGYDSKGTFLLRRVGRDFCQLDAKRYWGGSGRLGLSPAWADLDSLQNAGDTFTERWQQSKPYDLPFFPNNFGGHWHRLHIKPGQVPQWFLRPASHGVRVSDLLPGPTVHSLDSSKPSDYIVQRCEELKEQLKKKFGKRVRGSLKKISDPTRREHTARLVAIFNEVKLDPAIAALEDTQRYEKAAAEIANLLGLVHEQSESHPADDLSLE